jgi:LysR family transcriptional regulator, cyn operon transcriptional activator
MNKIKAITNMKKGRLRLRINRILGSHTFDNLLPQYISKYLGIEIELIEESAIEMEVLLLQRKIDICLNILPIFNPDVLNPQYYTQDQ